MAKGTFDELIRQESRRVSSRDGGDSARDRAARRMNARSGKNPNPRTSTAYKEDRSPPSRAKKASGGGGKAGAPAKKSKPTKGPSRLPDEMQVPGSARPDPQLPTVGTDPIPWLIPLIAAGSRMLARRRAEGQGVPEGPFSGAAQRVPTTSEPAVPPLPIAAPRTPLPEMPMAPDLDTPFTRFFSEGEIANMQKKMPGVINAPGWGTTKLPPGMTKGFRP